MKRSMLGIGLLVFLATNPVRADDEFDVLLAEFERAQGEWFEQLAKAEETRAGEKGNEAEKPATERGQAEQPAESQPVFRLPENLPPHPAEKFAPRFRTYAEKHAGKSEAIPALGWIIAAADMSFGSETQDEKPGPAVWALERLAKDHAADPAIKDVFGDLRYVFLPDSAPLVAFYEKVIKANSSDDTKAGATFNLASLLYGGSPTSMDDRPDSDKRVAEKKRGEALFRSLVKDYPDTKAAKSATAVIFEIEHLQVGMKAPEIIGKDSAGDELRLSKFLGRVVVLYFWGFW